MKDWLTSEPWGEGCSTGTAPHVFPFVCISENYRAHCLKPTNASSGPFCDFYPWVELNFAVASSIAQQSCLDHILSHIVAPE